MLAYANAIPGGSASLDPFVKSFPYEGPRDKLVHIERYMKAPDWIRVEVNLEDFLLLNSSIREP